MAEWRGAIGRSAFLSRVPIEAAATPSACVSDEHHVHPRTHLTGSQRKCDSLQTGRNASACGGPSVPHRDPFKGCIEWVAIDQARADHRQINSCRKEPENRSTKREQGRQTFQNDFGNQHNGSPARRSALAHRHLADERMGHHQQPQAVRQHASANTTSMPPALPICSGSGARASAQRKSTATGGAELSLASGCH